MKTMTKILLGGLLLLLAAAVFAQAGTVPAKPATAARNAAASKSASAVLEYFDDSKQLKIFNADGFEYGDIFLGMELVPGDRLQTAKSGVELRLNPNGSIIKLAPNTTFQINSLRNAAKGTNDIQLLNGKMRVVAARLGVTGEYQFRTKTSLAGVRGTDFGIELVDGQTDHLVVREGAVDFTQTVSGKTVSVQTGMGADTYDAEFAARQLTTREVADFFQNLDFVRLNPATVPNTPPAGGADTPAADSSASPSEAAASAADAGQAGDGQTKTTGDAVLNDPNMDKIKKFLGIEIGSVMLDGTTYGKLALMPRASAKDFRMQFYLPILYQSNLFDSLSWFRPNGNNEWSFGFDQGNDAAAVLWDFFRDVVLKVKYVELYKQGDPFYLKVGNIPSMTLGHGILIGGYANDSDFPAVRRLGVDIGVDIGTIAIQGLVNDLASLDIFGARLVWRPVAPAYKVAAGISAAVDLNPAGNLSAGSSDPLVAGTVAAKPVFLNVAADIEIPIIDTDTFGIMAYGDFGGMLPYFANGFAGKKGMISSGMQWANLFTLSTDSIGIVLKNYGIEAGVMGKVYFLDYRLEYQYFTGSFEPSYYDQTYDRTRGDKAVALYREFVNGTTNATVRMGIFGKIGLNIADLLYLSLGYKWPWDTGSSVLVPDGNPDYLTARLAFVEDALPYGIGFSIGLDRQYVVPCMTRPQNFTFFDQYAVFSARLELPIGNFFRLRVTAGTSAQRDGKGAALVENGKVVMKPIFGIESVF